jgi:hypothetical protein
MHTNMPGRTSGSAAPTFRHALLHYHYRPADLINWNLLLIRLNLLKSTVTLCTAKNHRLGAVGAVLEAMQRVLSLLTAGSSYDASVLQLQELPDYLKKDCLLFYFPEMESLAQKIAQASSKIELGRIRWA